MPTIIRQRTDIIELSPLRFDGPKVHGYRWKMIALLDLNESGELVLPNSQTVVEVGLLPWPREAGGVPPAGYEHCGCIGCENKSYADHILKNLNKDDDPAAGNIYLKEVYVDSEDESDDDDACVPLSMPSTFISNSCESDDWEI
ncbi:unnamed protein product [Rotaria magnacalcarata]|uniref:Uncharacterized protein n=1 Tax=Rotaria magnacalcarata TaxID=392030 RepID=A0A815AM14_9BILA|nr:unnamed protein product [Rotaria magnacalcarata]CAF2136021.1 unnamed protein product [Rotaria magnacalcarata]CAF2136399.1 unnamed protein product [Rotaria magnacalcarata]CAF2148111.1 unnamed protein product [Rotaria magnacalcarata]CAF3947879.1 unnamed protein product [Rotaria magnacalcarata]